MLSDSVFGLIFKEFMYGYVLLNFGFLLKNNSMLLSDSFSIFFIKHQSTVIFRVLIPVLIIKLVIITPFLLDVNDISVNKNILLKHVYLSCVYNNCNLFSILLLLSHLFKQSLSQITKPWPSLHLSDTLIKSLF